MPRATVTSRVLKNKDTGLELHVPTYKQNKESLLTVVHYQVVVVSNLACFKTPSHKESDVVQFSVDKKLNEFEDLRNKLTELYPGTMLPPIIKKSIIVNEMVLRERRNSLDQLLKFVAATPMLSTCIALLTFLGVDYVRATKFSKGEALESKAAVANQSQRNIDENEGELDSHDPIVFGEDEDSGNEDLFGDDENNDDMNDMFGNDDNSRSGAFKVFEGQDLKRGLTEEDEDEFSFVPNAILTKKEVVRQPLFYDEEDNSDLLLQIEDDFDALMNVNKGEKKTTASSTPSDTPTSNIEQSAATRTSRPQIPTKPSIPSKPSKPKPQIVSKPNAKPADDPTKPNLAPKPKPSVPSKSGISTGNPEATDSVDVPDGSSLGTVENLGQDDIMKYLQDNLDSNTEDVDLFS